MIAPPVLPPARLLERQRARTALVHSAAMAIACFISYWLITHILVHIHSISRVDDRLGGMWAVIATVFVYRASYQQTVTAALSRAAATSLSFALCLIYLLIFPFHPWGLALLIGIGTLVLMLIGRPDEIVTTAITTAVVIGVAGVNPHDAWEQPILRAFDTAVGIAVGLAASWIGRRLTAPPVTPGRPGQGSCGQPTLNGWSRSRPRRSLARSVQPPKRRRRARCHLDYATRRWRARWSDLLVRRDSAQHRPAHRGNSSSAGSRRPDVRAPLSVPTSQP